MRLDVYLVLPPCPCACPRCAKEEQEVFSANITHNLGRMASMYPGFYQAIWKPETVFTVPRAIDILPTIEDGYADMLEYPAKYACHDATNGGVTYVHFLPWVKRYLAALQAYPHALVRCCR